MIENRIKGCRKELKGLWEVVFHLTPKLSRKPVTHWVAVEAYTKEAATEFFHKQIAGEFTELKIVLIEVNPLICFVV